MQELIAPKSRQDEDRELPSKRDQEEIEKPRFCPTGYPDHNVYGAVLECNGVTVFLRRSAIHAQVGFATAARKEPE